MIAAFHMLQDGQVNWRKYKPTSTDIRSGYIMWVFGCPVERWHIQDYFTPQIMRQIDLYWKIKQYGWPYSGGWADQPANIFGLVCILDNEMEKRKCLQTK